MLSRSLIDAPPKRKIRPRMPLTSILLAAILPHWLLPRQGSTAFSDSSAQYQHGLHKYAAAAAMPSLPMGGHALILSIAARWWADDWPALFIKIAGRDTMPVPF